MDVIYINCKRTSLKQRKTAISNDIFYFFYFSFQNVSKNIVVFDTATWQKPIFQRLKIKILKKDLFSLRTVTTKKNILRFSQRHPLSPILAQCKSPESCLPTTDAAHTFFFSFWRFGAFLMHFMMPLVGTKDNGPKPYQY